MFFLARELGTTVGWLNENLSSYELTQWIEFYRMETEDKNKNLTGMGGEGEPVTLEPTLTNFRAAFGRKVKKKG